MLTTTIDLSLTPGGVRRMIHVSQYDVKARTLNFVLYDADGVVSLPSGVHAAIRGTKPDKNGFDYTATISGSTVTVEITEQMTAVAGNVMCELYLWVGTPPTSTTPASSNYEQLGTANFILQVERAALDKDTLPSDSEIRQIIEIDDNFDEIIDAAEAIQTALATAVRYDETQDLDSTEQATARTNISAASAADVTALGTRMTAAESDIDALEGSAIREGDYYSDTASPAYTDMNDLPIDRLVSLSPAVFNSLAHKPSFTADAGVIFVETIKMRVSSTAKNCTLQRVTYNEGAKLAVRTYFGNSWRGWVYYPSTSVTDTLTTGLATANTNISTLSTSLTTLNGLAVKSSGIITYSSGAIVGDITALSSLPKDSLYAIVKDAFNAMTDVKPFTATTGVFVETLSPSTATGSMNGGIQRATSWDGKISAIRSCVDGDYRAWEVFTSDTSTVKPHAAGNYFDTTTYSDLDNLPNNTLIGFGKDTFNNLAHKPCTATQGVFVETFSPYSDIRSGTVQRCTCWDGSFMATRAYVGSAYTSWAIYENADTINTKIEHTPRSVQNFFDNTVYSALSDLPNNTMVGFGKAAVNGNGTLPGLSDRPFDVSDGVFVETFSTLYNNKSGTLQRMTCWDGSFIAERIYAGGWRSWKVFYPDPYIDTINVSTPEEFIAAIVETMASGLAGPLHRYVINVAAGTYDLSGVADLVIAGTLDEAGLFLMPYTSMHGAGKDRTILQFYYNGSSKVRPQERVMSLVSALNMPYESELTDLTISVQNIRYPIHCSNPLVGQDLSNDNPLLVGNHIRLRNVRLEHLGFESGDTKQPAYKVPCAWGSGLWDGSDLEFINCDFFSKQHSAWLNHDHTDNTKDANVRFVDCVLHSDNGAYDGTVTASGNNACALISWGGAAKTHISFENTVIIPSLGMKLNSASVMTQCYDVKADTDIVVIEDKTNNAHTAKTYRVAGCVEGRYTPAAGVVAYTPVSMERLHLVRSYASSLPRHGIALNSAAQTEMVTVQTRGLVSLVMLGATGFSMGDLLGWNGSAWAVDSEHPLLKVIDNGLTAMLLA